jgi:hypothetical protein
MPNWVNLRTGIVSVLLVLAGNRSATAAVIFTEDFEATGLADGDAVNRAP